MIITITLNGVRVKKELPESWGNVTFQNYLDLLFCGDDYVKIIALFTGVEESILRAARIENLSLIISTLKFLSTPMKYRIPDQILGHKIPKDLELQTIGQFEDLKSERLKFSDDKIANLRKYPLIVATYLIDDYSWEAAEKLAPQLFNLSCQEVLAVGNFTLVKLIELRSNTSQTSLLAPDTPMNRLKLAMKAWLKNMAFSARYYLWKRRLRSIGLNS